MENRQERGLSLVELMIALSIIAVALFAIMTMFSYAMTGREKQREQAIAKQEAQAKLEELKAQSFTNFQTYLTTQYGTGTTTPPPPSSAAINANIIYWTFPTSRLAYRPPGAANWTPTAPPGLPTTQGRGTIRLDRSNPDLFEVIVTVEWRGADRNGKYSMRTVYSR